MLLMENGLIMKRSLNPYIMNYESVDAFKEQYQKVEEMFRDGKIEGYRYNRAFETVSDFGNYIKTEELGTRN